MKLKNFTFSNPIWTQIFKSAILLSIAPLAGYFIFFSASIAKSGQMPEFRELFVICALVTLPFLILYLAEYYFVKKLQSDTVDPEPPTFPKVLAFIFTQFFANAVLVAAFGFVHYGFYATAVLFMVGSVLCLPFFIIYLNFKLNDAK